MVKAKLAFAPKEQNVYSTVPYSTSRSGDTVLKVKRI